MIARTFFEVLLMFGQIGLAIYYRDELISVLNWIFAGMMFFWIVMNFMKMGGLL
jgi:hypothetical protein